MADFKQIDEARRLLGLDETADIEEIKQSYRELSLKYHPDRCKGKKKKQCEEMFKKINYANQLIMAYCAGYRYSFQAKEVRRSTMDKEFYEHLKRFYDGWWFDLNL
ncbi:MAG: DnaJ domain-containing protein [Candidatus Omnitrophica bacterium]|nr:DnaJ domain-containing protein [Candidatus Omnitrophota bacterium]